MSSRSIIHAVSTLGAVLFLILATPLIVISHTGGNQETQVSLGCEPSVADQVDDGFVLGLRTSGSSCWNGMRLMRTYHECLRKGGAEDYCRADGPRVQQDTPRFERDSGSSTLTPIEVGTEAELRAAWADPLQTSIELTDDIFMRSCRSGGPIRESLRPMTLDGNGHTIRMTCFEKRPLRQDGTGFLVIKNLTITRGGNDGPGAAVTTRGEIVVMDSVVHENLAEEPGGGIFSQRRATIIRSIFTGNFAWDDGGAVYARRGGVEVFDSIFSNNLVDGSGGAIGSTGDILVVRSQVDGNTTDGTGARCTPTRTAT